jgi:hypothetical protein
MKPESTTYYLRLDKRPHLASQFFDDERSFDSFKDLMEFAENYVVWTGGYELRTGFQPRDMSWTIMEVLNIDGEKAYAFGPYMPIPERN